MKKTLVEALEAQGWLYNHIWWKQWNLARVKSNHFINLDFHNIIIDPLFVEYFLDLENKTARFAILEGGKQAQNCCYVKDNFKKTTRQIIKNDFIIEVPAAEYKVLFKTDESKREYLGYYYVLVELLNDFECVEGKYKKGTRFAREYNSLSNLLDESYIYKLIPEDTKINSVDEFENFVMDKYYMFF